MEKVLTMSFLLRAVNITVKAVRIHPHGISTAAMRFQ